MNKTALQITVKPPYISFTPVTGSGVRLRIIRQFADIRLSFTGDACMSICRSSFHWLYSERFITEQQRDAALDTIRKHMDGRPMNGRKEVRG